MQQEKTSETQQKKKSGLSYEEALIAIAMEAQSSPDEFTADSVRDLFVVLGITGLWAEAAVCLADDDGIDPEGDPDNDQEIDEMLEAVAPEGE